MREIDKSFRLIVYSKVIYNNSVCECRLGVIIVRIYSSCFSDYFYPGKVLGYVFFFFNRNLNIEHLTDVLLQTCIVHRLVAVYINILGVGNLCSVIPSHFHSVPSHVSICFSYNKQSNVSYRRVETVFYCLCQGGSFDLLVCLFVSMIRDTYFSNFHETW